MGYVSNSETGGGCPTVKRVVGSENQPNSETGNSAEQAYKPGTESTPAQGRKEYTNSETGRKDGRLFSTNSETGRIGRLVLLHQQ